jgi:cation transport regulator
MHYDSESDLPDTVRNQLPADAQTVFRTAYNAAWETYSEEPIDPDVPKPGRHETAQQEAWNSVRALFERQENGEWRHRSLP